MLNSTFTLLSGRQSRTVSPFRCIMADGGPRIVPPPKSLELGLGRRISPLSSLPLPLDQAVPSASAANAYVNPQTRRKEGARCRGASRRGRSGRNLWRAWCHPAAGRVTPQNRRLWRESRVTWCWIIVHADVVTQARLCASAARRCTPAEQLSGRKGPKKRGLSSPRHLALLV